MFLPLEYIHKYSWDPSNFKFSDLITFPRPGPGVYLSMYLFKHFSDEIERMFDDKDKDLDGRLSFEEFMGETSRSERLFKLMDKDADGYVTKNVRF